MFSSTLTRLCAVALASSALFVGSTALAEVKKDLSSPKQTLTTLAHAMDQGDKQAARAAIAGNDKELKFVDGMVDFYIGMKGVQAAAKEKFGQVPDSLGEDADVGAMLAKLDQAVVKEEGDAATVTMPEPKRPEGAPAPTAEETAASAKQREMKLKKVGGEWKLEFASLMQGQELSDQQLEQFTALTKVTGDVAKEIREGKYPDYQTAMQAFGQRMMAAMMGGAPQEPPQDGAQPAPGAVAPAPQGDGQ